jgi:Na+/glutamate symporter
LPFVAFDSNLFSRFVSIISSTILVVIIFSSVCYSSSEKKKKKGGMTVLTNGSVWMILGLEKNSAWMDAWITVLMITLHGWMPRLWS